VHSANYFTDSVYACFPVVLFCQDPSRLLECQFHGLTLNDFDFVLYFPLGLNLIKGFGTSTMLAMTLHQGQVTAATKGEILPLDTLKII
jgi:hypothetical protein